ncbi:alkene reductase [Aquabacterium sp.]|uniref:alkene reductase n=1 Tax=Aquabacterium sp. TaxID=1872578 RepID=UPI002D0CAF71|nr:alkene reductase [Aquabacterium sp.]HSW07989.1 alkene reductase [Aquabacterium sp.]
MLFEPFPLRKVQLANRLVMSPLTRSRAVHDNTANALMATYYAQRAGAGLIITEGTSPSPNGLGYARIPGLFNTQHVSGWKLVTDAVHAKGGRIVVQLMHTGRVSHQANLPAGAEVLGPSAEPCPGEMWTDVQGSQPHTAPRAMTVADIATTIDEYVQAARLAMEAGFDGVELHAANGYLLEQFLNANINRRVDGYGGTPEGRNRLVLEVAAAAARAIGADRVGIRLSPHGVFNGAGAFPGVDEQYLALAKELSALGLMYAHVLDHSALGAPVVPDGLKAGLRAAFEGPFILAGGFVDKAQAEQALTSGRADLIAMGRPFLANPDLVKRLRQGSPLNAVDPQTFYTPGEKGYTDYPALHA